VVDGADSILDADWQPAAPTTPASDAVKGAGESDAAPTGVNGNTRGVDESDEKALTIEGLHSIEASQRWSCNDMRHVVRYLQGYGWDVGAPVPLVA
jgi:hypothetical protein